MILILEDLEGWLFLFLMVSCSQSYVTNSLSFECHLQDRVSGQRVMVHSQDPEILQYGGPGLQEAPESWDQSEVFRTAEAAQGWESGGIGTYLAYK